MPRFEVTAPDGRRFEVTAPEGANQDAVLSYARSQWERRAPQPSRQERALAHQPSAEERERYSPVSGMSTIERILAGAGKAFADIGRGAAQLVGAGPDAQELAEIRRRDAPLMETGAGTAGNIAGNVAALAPIAFVPGVNTVAGAAAGGGALGALQPAESGRERLTNIAVGAALGGGGQKLGQAGSAYLARRGAQKSAEATTRQFQHAQRDATLREAQQAGYVVPPSAVNPSFAAKRLEGMAGKTAVGQEAAVRNQEVTNSLAKQALGLPDDLPITEASLVSLRQRAADPYRELATLRPSAAKSLEQLKEARFQANAHHRHYNMSGDPKALMSARKFDATVAKLERMFDNLAQTKGQPDLLPRLKEARKLIAQSYDVEKALNLATGDIDARVIARLFDQRGSKGMTGPLALIGKFANAFSPYAREGAKIPTPGVSKIEALASIALGLGGAGVAGPAGGLLAMAPLASGPVRAGLLSKAGQAVLARARYPGAPVSQAVSKALPPDTSAALLRAIAAPTYFGGR